jgi:hypothetical protein
MGWDDRDWSAWSDDERREFYGSHGVSGRSAEAAPTVRVIVWGITATLVFLFVIWVAYAREAAPYEATPHPAVPNVIYGEPRARLRGGSEMVCVEKTVDQRTGAWACTRWALKIDRTQQFQRPTDPTAPQGLEG